MFLQREDCSLPHLFIVVHKGLPALHVTDLKSAWELINNFIANKKQTVCELHKFNS